MGHFEVGHALEEVQVLDVVVVEVYLPHALQSLLDLLGLGLGEVVHKIELVLYVGLLHEQHLHLFGSQRGQDILVAQRLKVVSQY